ncbi:flavin reductase family protein [Lysinibacillus sp. NPDC094177]|uniref:flavin reductase family protein n=1 Tax=Lysinibacillus sp. NPDC094177 TaxID=3390580 RepID=UPI003D07AF59
MEDRLFRNAMGKFATGVTVITTNVNGSIHGMTANAFMSVSLDPKLVVISIGEKASMLQHIQQSGTFTVNFLSAQQQGLSMLFAGQIKEKRQVTFGDLQGAPTIEGAIAQVSCEVASTYIEGDHTLFIGRVKNIHLEDGEPLLFFNGQYGALSAETTLQV